ncbi:MAG: response regulator [Verrucomicrobiota bacterium]
MKILVVDDEPMVCESMRMMLELDGHEMDEAYSGAEALDKLGGRRFDLVFTDFFMPGMRGDQFARELRGRTQDTPVVMVTGFPPNPTPSEVAKIVLKPFDLHSIRGILTQFRPTAR